MNNKFDELAKGFMKTLARFKIVMPVTSCAALMLAGMSALPVRAQFSHLGPLVEVSVPNPLAACDDGFRPGGTWGINDAGEPFVAINPLKPDNIVAAWMGGFDQNIVSATSFDGGRTWQQVPLPLTVCAGGAYLGAGDVWLTFAPNGELYVSALVGNSYSAKLETVCKSTDGGLHWSAPVFLTSFADLQADHPSITADPSDTRYVYAMWDASNKGHRGPSVFARSTDGGLTWEPPEVLVQPPSQNAIQFSQILVLPDGTLVDLYEQYFSSLPKKLLTQTSLQVVRSTDHGVTWSAPITAVTMTPLYLPSGATMVVDPETGQVVQDPTNPSFAVDRANGNLYAVWEDGRFSGFQYNDIAFSMSSDGGLTWSAPIRVNQTPTNIPALNRQAFLPVIAVAADGTIGVTHYDFRFNTPDPGVPTDYWLVQCQPTAASPATNPASWGNEVRLTDSSFNLEACITWVGGIFLGDYESLAGTSDGFVATFGAVDQSTNTAIFARSVGR
jgi:hypothetical protein